MADRSRGLAKIGLFEKMPFAAGVELLGLYKAYLGQVQIEACPRDALGNDEFGFFGSAG